jgi:hypothetical protein
MTSEMLAGIGGSSATAEATSVAVSRVMVLMSLVRLRCA